MESKLYFIRLVSLKGMNYGLSILFSLRIGIVCLVHRANGIYILV